MCSRAVFFLAGLCCAAADFSSYAGDRFESRASAIAVDAAGNAYQNGSLTGAAMGAGATVFSTGIKDEMTMSLNLDGLGVKKVTLGTAASLALAGDNDHFGKRSRRRFLLLRQRIWRYSLLSSFR